MAVQQKVAQITDLKVSQRGAWVSIGVYALLTGLKLGFGWWGGSSGLIADGVNNATDVLGSVAVLLGLRIALRPADADHRYGHERAENVAAMVVAAVMGLAGINVAISALGAVADQGRRPPEGAAVWVGILSAAAMLAVYTYNMRLARRTGSQALAAAAYDNRADALSSIGTVAGVIGSQLGWHWSDPVAGLLIALVILHTAWRIGFEAGHMLMDGFDADRLTQIRERVVRVKGVAEVRDLRARHIGNRVAVEVTVCVFPTLSVAEAHRICDRVEHTLSGFQSIGHVHVHVEPIA
ncbi:MAG: cation efflux system protein [Symbiobacteriaceae bacterium]|nr:cation efflux system protein [Symbiobacteriaceae bacterium]